jgi:integrase
MRGRRIVWVLKYKDLGEWRQKVIDEPVKSKREAEEWARGWIARQASTGEGPVRLRAGGPTVGELYPKFIKLRRDAVEDGKPRYATSTLKDYESHFRTDILERFRDTQCGRIDTQPLREWVRKLRAEHSAYRVRNIYSTFRSFFSDCMGEGWVQLAANPLDHPAVLNELPAAKAKRGARPVFVELEHMQRVILCAEVPVQRRVRWICEATCGATEGELAARTWDDVEIERAPVMRIHNALPTRGPDGWATIGPTKNEHRVRTIPLHAAAAAALRWWRREGWAFYVGRPPKPTDPIFPGPSGNFSRPASAAQLRCDLVAAGCPDTQHGQSIDAHGLRRSFATYLDAAGVPENQIGRLMGHAKKNVTAKHYTAAQVETDRDAVNKIALQWQDPCLVPVMVPMAPNTYDSQSHLRDLNPRPTVYENAGGWCQNTTQDDISRPHVPELAGSTNDKLATDGTGHQEIFGAGTLARGATDEVRPRVPAHRSEQAGRKLERALVATLNGDAGAEREVAVLLGEACADLGLCPT